MMAINDVSAEAPAKMIAAVHEIITGKVTSSHYVNNRSFPLSLMDIQYFKENVLLCGEIAIMVT